MPLLRRGFRLLLLVVVVLLLLLVGLLGGAAASGGPPAVPTTCRARQAQEVRQVGFHHLHKTGGSTLHNILRKHAHATEGSRVLSVHGPIHSPMWFRIAMFREPVSRVISHYWQVKPSPKHAGGHHMQCRRFAQQGFEQYLRGCEFAQNHQDKQLREQWGNAVDSRKVAAMRKYDLVLLTSKFHEGLVVLHLRIGIPLRTLLYWRLKDRSTRTESALHVTEELRDRVLQLNLEDQRVWDAARLVYNETVAKLDCDVARATQAYESMLARWTETCGDNTFMGDDACLVMLHPRCGKWRDRINTFDDCSDQFCKNDPVCTANNLLMMP